MDCPVEKLDYLVLANDENARKKSILLVDDDVTFLKTVKGWLASNYRVTIVTSGAQALMYIADNKPDLILLDYEMPVTSGPQVLEMIRSETRTGTIPVIFLTGKGDRESVVKVLALKPDGYLLKSTDKATLLKSLEDFFEKGNTSSCTKCRNSENQRIPTKNAPDCRRVFCWDFV